MRKDSSFDSRSDDLSEIDSKFDQTFETSRIVGAAVLKHACRVLVALFVVAAVAYLVDYFVLRRRNVDAFDSVDINRYYAVKLKNGKTELMHGDRETQTCVNSVFPHLGYSPCWYVRRHRSREVEIGAIPGYQRPSLASMRIITS